MNDRFSKDAKVSRGEKSLRDSDDSGFYLKISANDSL